MSKGTKSILVGLLIFVPIFLGGFLYQRYKTKAIEKHSKFSIARITRFGTSAKIGNRWVYQFVYNGKVFEGSRPTHVDYAVTTGDYFLVQFSTRKPDLNRILYDYKLSDSTKAGIGVVWDSIPFTILTSARKY